MLLALFAGSIILSSITSIQAEAALTPAQNESNYINLTNKMWSLYSEDLLYSSNILNAYTKNNISSREALSATISVFVLNSQTTSAITEAIAGAKPPAKYAKYHNSTVAAISSLQDYLLSLAKFYETGNIEYAVAARNLFNESIEHHDEAIEAAILMKH